MINYFDAIILKYPDIQGVTYWQTQKDGSPWLDPYDGLVWDNKETPKPTKNELDQWINDLAVLTKYEVITAEQKRLQEYPGIDKLVVALWKHVVLGDSADLQVLQARRVAVQSKYPKPALVTEGKQ